MSWRTEPDGMVVLTARLTPATAGAVCAVIDTHVTRAHAPAGASLAQQRADALVTALTTSKTSTGTGAASRISNTSVPTGNDATSDGAKVSNGTNVTAEMVIHVREDGSTLTDGTPLADRTVTSLLPDAFVSLLLHDTQRQPIDASPRRRFPTRRQRRVIDETHHECQHPGCHAQTFLQYDHIQPYDQNGPTVVDNLQRLCGPHNRARQVGRSTGTISGRRS